MYQSNEQLARRAGFKNAEQALAWERQRRMISVPPQAEQSFWGRLASAFTGETGIPVRSTQPGQASVEAAMSWHPAVMFRRIGEKFEQATRGK